jgi:uncharacterized protein (TIGR03437 family)
VLHGTGFEAPSASATTATVQGISAPVYYAGPQPTFAGLDQINALLPQSLSGTGVASVVVTINGATTNTVYISIE